MALDPRLEMRLQSGASVAAPNKSSLRQPVGGAWIAFRKL